MRLFTLIVSAVFVGIGLAAIASGDTTGWSVAGFFGLCLLVAILEPGSPRPDRAPEFRLLITEDEVACEHWKQKRRRKRESIRWEDVRQIWHVTISHAASFPHRWLLLDGEDGGCSFPLDAAGINGFWGELKQRFAGFDYKPLKSGATTGPGETKSLCWERPS